MSEDEMLKVILMAVAKPSISFAIIQKKMDGNAIQLDYKNHDDFLTQTGWKDRFVINNVIPAKSLKRMCEYWKDKKHAEKCGLEVKDICGHESDSNTYMTFPNYKLKFILK